MAGNVADLLRNAARKFPAAPAIVADTRQWTWQQLDQAADAGAASLAARGLTPGDRVVLHLPTGPELAVALFALARADLIAVPIDPQREPADIVAKFAAAALLTADFAGPAAAVVMDAAEIQRWFGTEAAPVEPTSGETDIAILARASRSGRAVMLSHGALLASVASIIGAPQLKLRQNDRVLLVLPLFHLAGFVTAFLPLATVGAAAVIADTPPVTGPNVIGTGAWTKFSNAVLTAVHDHRVTVIPGAPPLYRLLLRSVELERSLATVRLMTSAASPLSPQDGAAVRSRSGSPVWEGYGISEAASAVASTLMTSAPRPGSVGLPLPGTEVRIEQADDDLALELEDDDTLASLEADADPGRISIRGPQLFSGYWPDGADGPDDEGWFVTSDVGYLDKRGELHLIDRLAETIAIAGFTVYPREVESALLSHPFVRDVAVVGLPGRGGPELVAAVVATHGTTPNESDLTEHLTVLLPAFKRPAKYRIVSILPRTELGRLDRDAVRTEWADVLGIELPAESVGFRRLSVVSDGEDASMAIKPAAAGKPGAAAKLTAPPKTAGKVAPAKGTTPAKSAVEDRPGAMEPDEDVSVPPAAEVIEAEVIEVSQLDQLGSRLPGVGSRSRRSVEDSDSDLFGDDIFGRDLSGKAPVLEPD